MQHRELKVDSELLGVPELYNQLMIAQMAETLNDQSIRFGSCLDMPHSPSKLLALHDDKHVAKAEFIVWVIHPLLDDDSLDAFLDRVMYRLAELSRLWHKAKKAQPQLLMPAIVSSSEEVRARSVAIIRMAVRRYSLHGLIPQANTKTGERLSLLAGMAMPLGT